MYTAIKPSQTSQDITNILRREKHLGTEGIQAPSLKNLKYEFKGEDIKTIANLIEKHMVLQVNEGARKGDLKIFIETPDEKIKLEVEKYSLELNELKLGDKDRKALLEEFKKNVREELNKAGGYYDPRGVHLFVLDDSRKKFIENFAKDLMKHGFIKGKLEGTFEKKPDQETLNRVARFFTSNFLTHELIHQTLHENYPAVFKEGKPSEKVVILSPEWTKSPGSKDEAMRILDEAIAYTVTHEVMIDLGFGRVSAPTLLSITTVKPDIAKGIAFLVKVEKETDGNPIPFVCKEPPICLSEINNPEEYIKRIASAKSK